MPQDIVIQRESPDQPEVLRLLAELDRYLASLYPPEANHILGLPALLAPEVAFFVARSGGAAGAVVGTGAVRVMPGEPATGNQPYGELKRMMVEPAARSTGVGHRLLQALEHDLCARGVALALLETGRDQAAAVRLYRRAGYTDHPPFGGYPDNGLSLFLGRRLDAPATAA